MKKVFQRDLSCIQVFVKSLTKSQPYHKDVSREEMGRRIRRIHDGIGQRKIGVNAVSQPYSTINLGIEILGERRFCPKEW